MMLFFELSTIATSQWANILFMRMRVYLVGPVKTRAVNYLYANNLSAYCQIHHLEKRACAFFQTYELKVSYYSYLIL